MTKKYKKKNMQNKFYQFCKKAKGEPLNMKLTFLLYIYYISQ